MCSLLSGAGAGTGTFMYTHPHVHAPSCTCSHVYVHAHISTRKIVLPFTRALTHTEVKSRTRTHPRTDCAHTSKRSLSPAHTHAHTQKSCTRALSFNTHLLLAREKAIPTYAHAESFRQKKRLPPAASATRCHSGRPWPSPPMRAARAIALSTLGNEPASGDAGVDWKSGTAMRSWSVPSTSLAYSNISRFTSTVRASRLPGSLRRIESRAASQPTSST
mmetsp:Transcript_464/g.944  ORF Transcript_464/g.944 Transcript_464/m.944 type:complete len:219 (-) Transcript_464:770-1426(-)